MADIESSALESVVRRIIEDNQAARLKGREQAADLIKAMIEGEPEALENVVSDLEERLAGEVDDSQHGGKPKEP